MNKLKGLPCGTKHAVRSCFERRQEKAVRQTHLFWCFFSKNERDVTRQPFSNKPGTHTHTLKQRLCRGYIFFVFSGVFVVYAKLTGLAMNITQQRLLLCVIAQNGKERLCSMSQPEQTVCFKRSRSITRSKRPIYSIICDTKASFYRGSFLKQ